MDITEITREKERLLSALSFFGVPEQKIELYQDIIENVAWMKYKLDETRATIKNSSVAIPYDNGGGQTGIRENPLFKGYQGLFKSYMSGMNQILALLPDEVAEEVVEEEKPPTVLELIRNKHQGTA